MLNFVKNPSLNLDFFGNLASLARDQGVNVSEADVKNDPNRKLESDLCLSSGHIATLGGMVGVDTSSLNSDTTVGELVAYVDDNADFG